jgi:uncharacterized protein YndB with AHSA1/START domain
MTNYDFTSIWHCSAPPQAVLDVLVRPEQWRLWWPGLKQVHVMNDVQGPGAQAELLWHSIAAYELVTRITVTDYQPGQRVVFTSHGDLQGIGTCTISTEDGGTRLVFHWHVETTRMWMNILAPILKPLFRYCHNRIMRAGEQGLQQFMTKK